MSRYHINNTIDLVSLKINDLEKGINFYNKTLGFNILTKNANEVILGSNKPLIKLISDNLDNKYSSLYHIAFLLPNKNALSQILKNFIDIGFHIEGGSDHGVSEAIYLNDPFNNGIEIYYDKNESLWPKENDKLLMYTKGMDYDNLLSIKTEKFVSIPNDTVIGHIHMHSNNLKELSDFYTKLLELDLVLKYDDSAYFLSYSGYHHHIGMNTWRKIFISGENKNIFSFELKVDKEKFNRIFNKLKTLNYKYNINNDNNLIEIDDPNKTKIIVKIN